MRARKFRMECDVEPVWTPLETFADTVARQQDLGTVLPCDFMFMGDVIHRRGHRIHLYKNRNSRRHLNIDDSGHTYRYRGEVDPDAALGDPIVSWYVPHRDAGPAILHLELWMVSPTPLHELCDRCRLRSGVQPADRVTW